MHISRYMVRNKINNTQKKCNDDNSSGMVYNHILLSTITYSRAM